MICIVLAVLLLLMPAACITAFAEGSEELLYNGNIYYQINERDEIVITRSRASVTEAVIPAEIDGVPVTEIASSAFQGRTRLTYVSLPETVEKIGDYAFHQCTRLETVIIPKTVTYIGWNILEGTPWLQSQPAGCVIAGDNILIAYQGSEAQVVIPEGVTAIAGCAFEDCTAVMSVTIPKSVREIGGLAFSGCSKLTECTVPDGVESIGAYAFNWCVALQKVDIADSVKYIGNHAFVGCSSLISVRLPSKLSRIEAAVFCGCTSLTRIQIPASVTEIGTQAFYGCISLSDITLRSTVKSVGADAFGECSGLKSLTVFNISCNIADSEETVSSGAVICGFRESTAQLYAQSHGRQFVLAAPMSGDVNEDGNIDIADGSLVLSLYAKTASGLISGPTAYEQLAGDMNQNGIVEIADAAEILRIYAERSAGML